MAVKIGFVGSGGIANWHLEHLSKIKETRIVCLYDINKERVEAAARKWNAIMAVAIIQSIPVFIVFIIFREHLMKGIKLRGFK